MTPPAKLAAATRALRGDERPAPLERSRTPRLTHALQEALLLVCDTPFASVEDLAIANFLEQLGQKVQSLVNRGARLTSPA